MMSKRHRLAGLQRRIDRLKRRIAADTEELSTLTRIAGFMAAQIACDDMPDWKRGALVHSAMSTNLVPRKPVVRED